MSARCTGTNTDNSRCRRRVRGWTACHQHRDDEKRRHTSEIGRVRHGPVAKVPSAAPKEAAALAGRRDEPLPAEAAAIVERLTSGNRRFRDSRVYRSQRARTAAAQRPLLIVVSCSDSRADPAIVFSHLDLGCLFQVRTAGHVVAATELDSIRYAVRVLGLKLVVVLGHTRCGAVTAVFDAVANPGAHKETRSSYPSLVAAIQPAVRVAGGRSREHLLESRQPCRSYYTAHRPPSCRS